MKQFTIVLCAALTASLAEAQPMIWNNTDGLNRTPAKEGEPPPEGWLSRAALAANLSFTSSEDVVGQTNGSSQTYGLNFKGALTHLRESHEWRNEFTLREATTKTPNLPRFAKSDDEAKLSTIFLYSLPATPKIGPYARAEAAAPVFKGEDVRPEVKTYRVKHSSGAENAFNATSIRLSDPLRPLTTKEATGFFYRPVKEEKISVETRVGFAGQQIRADGQFVQKGANAAGEIQVEELKNINQAGLEAGLLIKGKLDERSSYELGADSLTPFINNKAAGDNRSAWRLTNVEAHAKLTSKFSEWISFSYDYKLKMQPQLIERAQQIHAIVLNLTYPTSLEKL